MNQISSVMFQKLDKIGCLQLTQWASFPTFFLIVLSWLIQRLFYQFRPISGGWVGVFLQSYAHTLLPSTNKNEIIQWNVVSISKLNTLGVIPVYNIMQLTNVFHRVRALLCHTGSHTLSLEDNLFPFMPYGGYMLFCKELIMAENSSHITMQCITS